MILEKIISMSKSKINRAFYSSQNMNTADEFVNYLMLTWIADNRDARCKDGVNNSYEILYELPYDTKRKLIDMFKKALREAEGIEFNEYDYKNNWSIRDLNKVRRGWEKAYDYVRNRKEYEIIERELRLIDIAIQNKTPKTD